MTVAPPRFSGSRDIVQVRSPPGAGRSRFRAKGIADEHLKESGLDFTVVRPGRLTDDPGRGTVEAGDLGRRGEITRDDVAAFIVPCLDDDNTVGKTIDILEGDTPIRDAAAEV